MDFSSRYVTGINWLITLYYSEFVLSNSQCHLSFSRFLCIVNYLCTFWTSLGGILDSSLVSFLFTFKGTRGSPL